MSFPLGTLATSDLSRAIRDFNARHEALYGFCQPERSVEIINFRCRATVETPKPEFRIHAANGASPVESLTGTRDCYLAGRFEKFSIFDGAKLQSGNIVDGPGIVELPASTIVVPPGIRCQVDEFDNFVVSLVKETCSQDRGGS